MEILLRGLLGFGEVIGHSAGRQLEILDSLLSFYLQWKVGSSLSQNLKQPEVRTGTHDRAFIYFT